MNFSIITYKHQYPILVNGVIKTHNESFEIGAPIKNEWQPCLGTPLTCDINNFPYLLEIKFQALTKSPYLFTFNFDFFKDKYSNNDLTNFSLTLAIGPNGHITMWLFNEYKAIIICNHICEPIEESKISEDWKFKMSMLAHITKGWDKNQKQSDNTQEFDARIINGWLKYNYRFIITKIKPMQEKVIAMNDNLNLSCLLFDGTYIKDGSKFIFDFHEASKPRNIAIKWRKNNIEYSVYFWLDEDELTNIFKRFYGAHPETKADFIIRIDAENKKYELALFRQGLKEPVVIPESAYQLIVFKNKFEDYRSENYDQPRGAWIW